MENQIQENELREWNKKENTKPECCIIFRHSLALCYLSEKPEEKQNWKMNTQTAFKIWPGNLVSEICKAGNISTLTTRSNSFGAAFQPAAPVCRGRDLPAGVELYVAVLPKLVDMLRPKAQT